MSLYSLLDHRRKSGAIYGIGQVCYREWQMGESLGFLKGKSQFAIPAQQSNMLADYADAQRLDRLPSRQFDNKVDQASPTALTTVRRQD